MKFSFLNKIAILGIAALSHHKHHYKGGYHPADSDSVAEFERGYRKWNAFFKERP